MEEPKKLVFEALEHAVKKEGQEGPIVLDHVKLMDLCLQAIEKADDDAERVYMYLPSEEFIDTKKNKVYLIQGDDSTPQGLIMKGDINATKFRPRACARYDAFELFSWLVVQTNDIEERGEASKVYEIDKG